MLLPLLALAIGICAVYVNQPADEITRLLIKLVGLVSLFLGLLYAPWSIKLLIVIAILATPICAQKRCLPQIHCPTLCIARRNCPQSPF
ncbi:hypothetical protein HJG54_28840 [Leptolyngbya sp. NK1-12]|uniref:Uncharacterized protein n=1 Tax=Leptolyngbya sp. NK1-12 TaxID=2547451 RepID=A0AA96WYA9_9CYAN|nr:hypothetical protein [Leptolyngbya sp. NK1-12]WNZ26937.1 hypothetical protein HJG54_28840 [Leptolyngbya sp. NK1-12]